MMLLMFFAINASNHFHCDQMELDNYIFNKNLQDLSHTDGMQYDQRKVLCSYSIEHARNLAESLKNEIHEMYDQIVMINYVLRTQLNSSSFTEKSKNKIFELYINHGKTIYEICERFLKNVKVYFNFRLNEAKKTEHILEHLYTDHFYNLSLTFNFAVRSYYQRYCGYIKRLNANETITLDVFNIEVLEKLKSLLEDIQLARLAVIYEIQHKPINGTFCIGGSDAKLVNHDLMTLLLQIETIGKTSLHSASSHVPLITEQPVDLILRLSKAYIDAVECAYTNYKNCLARYLNLETIINMDTTSKPFGNNMTSVQHADFSKCLCEVSEKFSQKAHLLGAYKALVLLQRELYDPQAVYHVKKLSAGFFCFIFIDSTLSTVIRNITSKYQSLIRNGDFENINKDCIHSLTKIWLNLLKICSLSIIQRFEFEKVELKKHLEADKLVRELQMLLDVNTVNKEISDERIALDNGSDQNFSISGNASVNTHPNNYTTNQNQTLDTTTNIFLNFSQAMNTYTGL